MDSHNKYLSHHRQSLRPGSGTAMTSMLASRYGIQLGGTSTGKRGSTSTGSLGSSPIRSRSNSTSRFKAAAAVAVAAATGNKQFGNSSSSSSSSSSSFYHRPSISPASFNLRSSTSGGSSTITSSASSSSTSSSSTTSGANCSSSSSAAQASSSSSYTSGSISAAQGVGAGISSTVVSFMKKFVNKATPNSNISDSIDQSIEQYQKQQQQQQQQQRASNSASSSAQSPTKYLFTAITGSNSGGGQTADTGYSSSNMDSPVTTPTPMTNYTHQQQNINNSLPPLVPGSSQLSTSPSCSNANNIMTTCSPTDSLNSMNQFSVAGCNSYISNHPTTMVVSSSSSTASSRPTSAASSVLINSQNNVQISNNGSSARNGPIFSKIRAKVASTFQQQQQIQSVDIQSPSTVPRTTMAIGGDQIGDSFLNNQDATNKARSGSISSTSGNNLVGTPVGASGGSPTTTGTGYQRAPMLSMMSSQSSSLTNEQLTAHLTDEERQILQKVWQKEEEFREIALKNFNKNMTNAVEILAPEESTNSPSTTCNNNNNNNQMMISSGQTQGNLTAVSTGSVSHLSTNLLDPVAAAVHRRRSSAIMSADATGFCRICRKIIMKNETSHRCSNCQELVCDDCSSYSSRDDTKYWMCSFCRRRGSHLVLVTTSGSTPNSNNLSMTMAHGATGTSTVSLIIDQHSPSTMNTVDNSNVQPSMAASNQQRFLSTTATPLSVLNTKRKLSFQELQRPQSAFDQYGNGQPTGHSQQQQQQQRLQQQPNQHQQTSSQQAQNRQSSLDLSRAKPEMMKFSRNLPQIPIQQSQQQQPPQPSPSPQPANNQLHPSNIDTNRTRIYSLSDDEELWNDDDDDDDDDGDDDDDLGGNGNEMNDNDDDDDDDDDVIIMLKDHVEQDQQVLDDYAHYGTLQTVPVEQLKLQRLLNHKKKKKKKKHPHSAQQGYNSDDELLMANSYGKGNQDPLSPRPPAQTSSVYSSTPPITITSLDDPDDPILTVTTNQASASGDVGDQLMMIQQPSLSSSHFPTTRSLPQQPPSLQNTSGVGVSYQQCQTKQPKVGNINLIGGKPLPASAITAAHWWRLTNKARSLCRANGGPEAFYGTRKQHSSESSDFSDGFKYSPPQESLTPSSEYSRSPRESVDSDMLGLNQYHSSNMSRAIPSVMIGDVSGGGGASTSPYLSTKDCYLRRGSAGRALPKIPLVASGSSMLDLPHSRKNSQQSLDIPAEQPRRASAPESGDPIRIVIDEPTDLSAGHLESTATSTGSIDQITTKMASPLQTSMVRHHRQPHHQTPGPSIIQVPNTATLQQRMRYQLSRAASITTHYERVVLQRDQTDQSTRTRGFSLAITGGKLCEADGMLYAYVTWIKPGGQADSNLLKSGDKILEWNGKSLVNCSHEQVCNIMDISGDMAELIIESMVRSDQPAKRRHSLAAQQPQNSPSSTSKQQTQQSKTGESSVDLVASTASSATSTTICARPSSAAALISTTASTTASGSLTSIQSIASSASTNIGNHVGSLRRRLPQIPTQQQSQMGSTSNSSASSSISMSTSSLLSDAQIFLQVTIDANIRQLSVMIIQAKGLDRHPIYVQNPGFEAYAQLRLLPEMGFKICQTELSRPFDWNETLIYHQFPLERIEKITLDLSVWCTTPSTYIPGVGAGGSRSPRITVTGATIAAPPDYQLASTRIPLRSALLMHISEWWPLIPCNMEQPASLPLPPTLSFNSQSSLADSTSTSMAPTVFFQKAPSMDHIGDDPSALLSDQMMRIAMTSHSTPGSRRNSSRNEQNDQGLLFGNQTGTNQSMLPPKATSISARVSPLFMGKTSATPPPPASASWFQRYRSSPSRASATSIISSNSTTGGRHSLDESYSITNSARSGGGVSGPPSLSCKFTSLRSTPNRHSIGNLYQIGPNGGPRLQSNAQQQQQSQLLAMDNLANRRKSSSALTQGSRNKLFVPGSSRGYNQFGQTDSYQYLLEQTDGIPNRSNSEMGYQSDQESELDTSDDDEDFANLLKDSSYTLDSLDNRPQLQTSSSPIKISSPEKDGQKPMDKIPTMDMPDKNLLSIDVHGSRYSVATTSDFRTPSHDEDFEDDNSQNGGLTIPVCQERRPSFLRRLMPSAAETVMNMVMGGPASNAQPSDEILHPITGIGGQPGSTTDSLASEHPKRRTIVVVGEIKLGFVMTKGFLEIEVIAARNLPDSSFGPHPPDTYVKTYLVDRGRQLYKRKTRVVSSDKNPQYRQTLKYDASIIYGRTLLVSVWEKQHRRRTFDTNTPIGSVEINVNQLQLHKLTIRWFKLRSLVENQAQQTESFDDNEITANIAIGSSSGDHHQPPASLTG